MKKRHFLLALVILITFTGGFFAGFSYNKQQPIDNFTLDKVSPSETQPKLKQIPEVKQEQSKKVLIGYVQDFRDPEIVDYNKLTHVIFSFAHPTKDGRLLMNGEPALNNLRKMVAKAHKHDTKAILAIGGWYHINGGESYDYFKAAISNAKARTILINELVNMTEREKLDGIDIDFEHPRSREDAKNLALFTKDLSTKLHKSDKELSIAVNAKVHSVAGTEINNVVYNASMFQHVDHVNIMAYDGHWDGSYNAANLSPYTYNENIVNYWSNLFEVHHISKEKLVLGVPFYAQPEDPTIKQISYETIINTDPANALKDTVKMHGTTYHYNGEKTVQKKTKLALDHGFGGMMLWEAGHDSKGEHSLTNAISEVLTNGNLVAIKDKRN
jgi:chitinase